MTITRAAIVLFLAAVVLGPVYTAPGYSSIHHVISALAAQNTSGSFIMSAAFVILGVSIAVEGMASWRRSVAPFVVFGLCFAAAGLFGHRPITEGVPYSVWQDQVHSVLATLSGIALTAGFVWQAVLATTRADRAVAITLGAICVGLPLVMLSMPDYQGAVQRVMYLLVFAWLWKYHPRLILPRSTS